MIGKINSSINLNFNTFENRYYLNEKHPVDEKVTQVFQSTQLSLKCDEALPSFFPSQQDEPVAKTSDHKPFPFLRKRKREDGKVLVDMKVDNSESPEPLFKCQKTINRGSVTFNAKDFPFKDRHVIYSFTKEEEITEQTKAAKKLLQNDLASKGDILQRRYIGSACVTETNNFPKRIDGYNRELNSKSRRHIKHALNKSPEKFELIVLKTFSPSLSESQVLMEEAKLQENYQSRLREGGYNKTNPRLEGPRTKEGRRQKRELENATKSYSLRSQNSHADESYLKPKSLKF